MQNATEAAPYSTSSNWGANTNDWHLLAKLFGIVLALAGLRPALAVAVKLILVVVQSTASRFGRALPVSC